METHSPGTLDLIPNAPGQPRRHLDAERMSMAYGDKPVEIVPRRKTATDTRKPRQAKMKADLAARAHVEQGSRRRVPSGVGRVEQARSMGWLPLQGGRTRGQGLACHAGRAHQSDHAHPLERGSSAGLGSDGVGDGR
jgi:hypothetical protein